MNPLHSALRDTAPEPLAEALIRTLESESSTLELLDGEFQLQREAIGRRDFALIEEATQRTNEQVAQLESLRNTRQRQARLLARVLEIPGDDVGVAQITERLGGHLPLSARLEALRDEIRARADAAQDKIDEVAFLLQHGLSIGQDMIQAMHGIDTPAGGAYDASGRSAPATQSNMLNRTG